MGQELSVFRKMIADTESCSKDIEPIVENLSKCMQNIQDNLDKAVKIEESKGSRDTVPKLKSDNVILYRCFARAAKIEAHIKRIQDNLKILNTDLKKYKNCYDDV